jgi:hypothetical protein
MATPSSHFSDQRISAATAWRRGRRSYPHRFQRVRHYGWRGAAAKAKWERILALLDWRVPLRVPPAPLPPPQCPCCGKPMFLIGTLPRAPTGWRVELQRET